MWINAARRAPSIDLFDIRILKSDMGLLRAKLLFLGAIAVPFVLAGCGAHTQQTANADNNSEHFLKSTGRMQAENGPDDPLAMHLAARKQVDPRDTSSRHAYTTTPTKEQVYRQADERVVEMASNIRPSEESPERFAPPVSAIPEPVQSVQMQPALQDTAPQNIIPAAGTVLSEVTAVRIGRHPDKTRLVFDLSGPGKFSYDIDPTGRVLSVRLPQSGWSAAPQSPGSGGLVKSLHAAPAPGGGVAVNIELSRPGRLAYGGALPPNAVHGDRIVFDVAPL